MIKTISRKFLIMYSSAENLIKHGSLSALKNRDIIFNNQELRYLTKHGITEKSKLTFTDTWIFLHIIRDRMNKKRRK